MPISVPTWGARDNVEIEDEDDDGVSFITRSDGHVVLLCLREENLSFMYICFGHMNIADILFT